MGDREKNLTELAEIPSGLELLHTLRGHKGAIGRIAWSPDGSMIASPSADKTVRVWSAKNGEQLQLLQGHTDRVIAVAWAIR